MPKSVLEEDPALIHAIALGAILCGGIVVTTQMPRNDISSLIYGIIDSAGINTDNLSSALDSIRSLPVKLQILPILLMVKGISFLKVAPVLLFGYLLGTVDAGINLCELERQSAHSSHSVTGYHLAKKMFMFSLLYMPLMYISFPFELILHTRIDLLKYCFIGINAAVGYFAVYSLNINKPPRM